MESNLDDKLIKKKQNNSKAKDIPSVSMSNDDGGITNEKQEIDALSFFHTKDVTITTENTIDEIKEKILALKGVNNDKELLQEMIDDNNQFYQCKEEWERMTAEQLLEFVNHNICRICEGIAPNLRGIECDKWIHLKCNPSKRKGVNTQKKTHTCDICKND